MNKTRYMCRNLDNNLCDTFVIFKKKEKKMMTRMFLNDLASFERSESIRSRVAGNALNKNAFTIFSQLITKFRLMNRSEA